MLRALGDASTEISQMVQEQVGTTGEILEAAEKKIYAIRKGERGESLEPISVTLHKVFDRLKAENIIARKYFYPLTNSFKCYEGQAGFDPTATPVAMHIAQRVLTLPMYAGLSREDVDRICDIILDVR